MSCKLTEVCGSGHGFIAFGSSQLKQTWYIVADAAQARSTLVLLAQNARAYAKELFLLVQGMMLVHRGSMFLRKS